MHNTGTVKNVVGRSSTRLDDDDDDDCDDVTCADVTKETQRSLHGHIFRAPRFLLYAKAVTTKYRICQNPTNPTRDADKRFPHNLDRRTTLSISTSASMVIDDKCQVRFLSERSTVVTLRYNEDLGTKASL